MTPQQIVGLTVRLFSIWLIVLALQIIGYGNSINSQSGIEETQVHYLLSAVVLVLAAVLWFFPMAIAHKLIPKTQFNNVLSLPLHETIVVACIIFAMWLFLAKVLPALAFYIPLFVVMVHDKRPVTNSEEFHIMRLVPIAIQFVVAFFLMFKARAISKFLVTTNAQSGDGDE